MLYYSGLLLISAATILLELTLLRLFAVQQFYHFAFMAVSLALLGAGASGTFLSLRSPSRQGLRRWLALCDGLGFDRGYVTSMRGALPATRFACDAYVKYVRDMSETPELFIFLAQNLHQLMTGREADDIASNADEYGKQLTGPLR